MKSYIMVLHLVLIFLSIGCKEDDNIRPFGKDVEAGAPGVVSEIKVKNIPGGAVISYQLPDNPDIMYVRARYKVGQGKEMEARASVYANELTVNGFGDMNEYFYWRLVDFFSEHLKGKSETSVDIPQR